MQERTSSQILLALISVLLIFSLAFGLDQWIAFLSDRSAVEISQRILALISYPLAAFVLAVCLLFLFWFIVIETEANRWIGGIFIFSGALILIYPAASLLFRTGSPILLNYLAPKSFLSLSAAFIAATGLLSLLLPRLRPLSQIGRP
jgi:hypothetical protein